MISVESSEGSICDDFSSCAGLHRRRYEAVPIIRQRMMKA